MPTKVAGKRTVKRKRAKPPAVPRTHKPADLTLEQWQVALRRQFGREQKFKLVPVDGVVDAVFGDYLVTNPESGGTYRVGIRGAGLFDNGCTCPDYAVNTLGTCKHVEFTLGRLERRPGGRRLLAAGWRPPFTEVVLRYGPDGRRVVVRRGTEVDAAAWSRAARDLDGDALKPEAFDRLDTFLDRLRAGGHEVRCQADVVDHVAGLRDGRQLVARVDALFPQGADDPAWAELVKMTLYPYQRTGARFLARAGRALLADDMGLGKTVQSIAAAEVLARAAGIARVLVVTPTSLKHQWRREIAAAVDRPALVVEGPPAVRRKLLADPAPFFKVTNYETVHLDADAIAAWGPDLIILDEAQRIKNWRTRTAQAVKALQSPYAFVLSGTPLENRLEELHSIMGFVDRYRLGPLFRYLADHQQLDADGRVVGYKSLTGITATLAPVLLRRTKDQVLKQLPGRMEQHVLLPMTPEQSALHEDNRQTVARLVFRWRKMRFLTEADQRRLTCALQNMRMSCNSTFLLDHETDFGTKADEIVDRVDELLEQPGAKVVIFSQWVRSHELLIRRLGKRKRKHVFLHGGVPGPKRQALVDRFRDDPACRIFLSTDAGGVGLNLQAASAVFNMDQPWNPAILEQRIGRVHRLGQTRPVQVVHFVARDTIEHGMLDLIKFKRHLFAGVLDGGRDEVFMGGTRLKKFMDGVEAATAKIPADAVPPDPEQAEPAAAQPPPDPAPALPPPELIAPESMTPDLNAEPPPMASPGASPETSPVPPAVVPDGFAPLVDTLLDLGRTFVQHLTQPAPTAAATMTTATAVAEGAPPRPPSAWRVEADPATGRPSLRVPMPSPEVVAGLGRFLAALTAKLTAKP